MSADIEIAVIVKATTKLAMLVNHGAPNDIWIAKSLITDHVSESGELDSSTTSIFLPEWIATQKGFL